MKTPRPKDRITAGNACPLCIHPADYLRAVKIKRKVRRYTLAERVLAVAITSLVAALILHLFRA